MAKQTESNKKESKKINRPGVHSKNSCSKLKSSKKYKKRYVGQGR
jgi:hypothetical protein